MKQLTQRAEGKFKGQGTAVAHSGLLEALQVNMDGRGRALDNVSCEGLWRSVRYENIYLMRYGRVRQLQDGLIHNFDFYNHERPRQSLNYCTPAEKHIVR